MIFFAIAAGLLRFSKPKRGVDIMGKLRDFIKKNTKPPELSDRARLLLILLGFALALGGTLAIAGDARAQTAPAAVATLVGEVTYAAAWEDPPGTTRYKADVNLTWRLSSNDPDQTAGTWSYYILQGDGSSTLWLPAAETAIAGRPGWVSVLVVMSGLIEGTDATDLTFSIVANDTGSSTSSPISCVIELDITLLGAHDQCGVGLLPPSGVNVIATNDAPANYGANATVRWRLSANDTDQINGSLEYWLYTGLAPEAMFNNTETQVVDSPGIRRVDVVYSVAEGGTLPLYSKVLTRDPLTRERSAFSCVVYVTNGEIYARSNCGTLGAPSGGFDTSGPTFPMVNIAETAGWLGVGEGVVGAFLGASFVLGMAFVGFASGGAVAGMVAGVGSIVLIAVLGIMPLWVLVVVFLAAATIIVFALKGRDAG